MIKKTVKPKKTPKKRRLTNREISHILAALRYWQDHGCCAYEEIATDRWRYELMYTEEVDELCEALNIGDVH